MKGTVHIFAIFLSLFCFGLCSWSRNQITFTNGGYNNVLIAINKDIPENQQLVDTIKEIFTSASEKLLNATNKRAYWRSISILVPKSWQHKPEYEAVTSESFDRANVVIDFENPRWGDNPYTKQLGGCGEPGEYIHLTPNYILEKSMSEYIWGPMDKLLLHEWGHLRWGLFDEYTTSDPGSAPFYATSSNTVEATRCSLAITGQYVNIFTLRDCYLDPDTGIYQPECVFFPDVNGQTTKASIMYGQFIDSVYTYCHSDSSDPLGYHNVEAPHKHNIMCSSKSSWDVMLESDDFKNNANPPIEGKVDTKPIFRIIQARERRVVLVLDTSDSMRGERLEKLLQSATQYLRYTIDEGSYVGIVEFNIAAYVVSELVYISDNNTSREVLVAALPVDTERETCIGCGILDGIEVLSRNGDDPAGGYLLVISDGKNTQPPGIKNVIDEVNNAGVIIDTIAFTNKADTELTTLSEETGGIAFFFAGDSDISVLNNAFTATVTTRPDVSTQSLPITLYSDSLKVPVGANISDSVFIDSTVGLETVFTFSWIGTLIQLWLESPDGNFVDQNQYIVDKDTNIITIKINDTAMTGYWVFTVANVNKKSPSQVATVTVTSKQSSKEDPIEVLALVSDPSINYSTEPVVAIYAIVTKGYLPVINAQVFAVVQSPDAIEEVPLFDNGAEPDITEDDGVYSGYYLGFSNNGRYSVAIKVNNSAQMAMVNMAKVTGSLPIKPESTNDDLPVFEPTGMFVRITSGGVIQVENYVDNPKDNLAPSRILDLSVVKTSYSEQSVVLQWTAVGDDFNKGTATKYELMAASNYSKLFYDFANSRLVTNDDLILGNMSIISPAGTRETVTIRVPTRGEDATYFFAIRAHDESDNYGEVSNIVSANMEYIPPIPAENQDPEKRIALWATLGTLGIAIFAGIIFAFFRSSKQKKNKLNKVEHSDNVNNRMDNI
ncbi:calcium-activated chloride channel regulator 1-like isoform X2 [Anneissia japonica]|uniref:calcium-activated chloride channel regulator 1-like isoform X2 n=1 Tax=Anneissia japonica TaxID=1529436 RepID=UPI0014259DFB|nr:calcium-activated chloride channel regulator 1-like isoform X2 [Anneissia japonica]